MRSEFCSEHKYRSLTFNTSMGNTSMIKQDYIEIKDRVAIIFYEQYYKILPVICHPHKKGRQFSTFSAWEFVGPSSWVTPAL